MKRSVDRREFLRSSAAGAIAAGLTTIAPNVLRAARSANERIVVGVLGVNGRGKALANVLAAQPDVDIAYLCDVDERVIGAVSEAVSRGSSMRRKRCKIFAACSTTPRWMASRSPRPIIGTR